MTMLKIENLHANVGDTEILKGLNFQVNPGEVHAIMGPNGSGKTTFSNVIVGRDDYTITKGSIAFEDEDLTQFAIEERAARGIFLAMQYPIEIPGVNNLYFLKTAINSIRKQRGEEPLDAFDFMQMVKGHLKTVGMDEKFLKRSVNTGFSGGEKKRNEILQMLLLQPKLAILDETDSGLDVDALRVVSNGVNSLRDPNRAIIVITHYQRLLNYIEPDFVHVLAKGRIMKTGDKYLSHEIESEGYAWLDEVQ